ncbi:uncharacterized protein K460DRAFT_395266 [Cucurbitaria berberidis CBS 394.84]|uniref:Uncharacterized protein n=1 Tax=Cucurbitaria berberidis CBS 394.84 TaxID=1168544 RepID=A0A9P4GGI2_9PLEO|nr:uncharacterized protein K460DRAFT_395266 [Cucurbitaria berberidis CBS 394.84]KAF1845668.1 hypothetical protein K460DRAFT_395266 [Cucurbitaria berberidis CBS 394.84]
MQSGMGFCERTIGPGPARVSIIVLPHSPSASKADGQQKLRVMTKPGLGKAVAAVMCATRQNPVRRQPIQPDSVSAQSIMIAGRRMGTLFSWPTILKQITSASFVLSVIMTTAACSASAVLVAPDNAKSPSRAAVPPSTTHRGNNVKAASGDDPRFLGRAVARRQRRLATSSPRPTRERMVARCGMTVSTSHHVHTIHTSQ